MATPTRTATPGAKSTPRNTYTPSRDTPTSKGGKGQLLRYSSFYPGVKDMSQAKKPSLLLTGNQMKTGGPINKKSKAKSQKESSSEFGHIPKPTTKFKRKVAPDVKERQAKFDAMIEGELTDLPPLPKSAVRIFLSSTFSDMRAERNTLARMVYPVLKDYCASVDLDFQVVDMRWGITEDSQNDHSVEDLCLREIINCRNLSLGPNFVCILGDRYGFQLIPNKIESLEFEALLEETVQRDTNEAEILTNWYLKDENAVPHQHVLQPVRTFYPNFGIHKTGLEEASAADSEAWNQTLAQIRHILRTAASGLREKGQMTQERFQHFHWSVTECEINAGVLTAKESQDNALFFHRELVDLPESCADDEAWKYIDLINSTEEVDSEARRKLNNLATNVLPKALGKDNCFNFRLPWRTGGVNELKSSEHSSYIFNFCKTFILNVTRLIDKAHDKKHSFINQSEYYTDPEEIIHHLQFCADKCKTFCGRQDILKTVKHYILDQSERTPLIIHAESGAGKTSLMAAIMSNLSPWFKKPFISVIRFLGTSPQTINLYDVLFSVCGQLADATDLIMEPVGYNNFSSLVQYMPRFLRRVASAAKVPVVILLDSVDQLSPSNSAYLMKWLPLALPGNVKLILSTLPRENGILTSIRRRLTNANCFVEVPILPKETVQEIVTTYMSAKHRALTRDQSLYIIDKFNLDPSPLYLKLLLDRAVTWQSFTKLLEMRVGESAKQAIHLLFAGLEHKYGLELIQAALGYITVSLNGITEIELEDVLSCDNEVLDSVYQFHDPPVEGIVRIPSLLWARIYHDLKEYLVERVSQGKTTLYWYHRQFIEAAKERFLNGQEQVFHKKMLEIFLAESGIKKDITLSRRQKTIPHADRQVTQQPMVIKNKRKLECITHHLINAKSEMSMDEAKEHVFCNYDFLATKICAFSVRHVIDEMDKFLENMPDREISKIRNFMQITFADLRYPMQLAVHLLAGVSNTEGCMYLDELLQQAKSRIFNHPSPVLIPEGPCLVPRELSDSSLLTCNVGCKQIISCSDKYIITNEEGIEESNSVLGVFNMSTGEHKVTEQIKFNDYLVEPLLIEDDIYVISENSISVYNLVTNTIKDLQMDLGLKIEETIKTCALSKDAALFAAFTSENRLYIWDILEVACIKTMHLPNWTGISNIARHKSEPHLVVTGDFLSDGQEISGVVLKINLSEGEPDSANTPKKLRDGGFYLIPGTSYVVVTSNSTDADSDVYILCLSPMSLVNTIKCSCSIIQTQAFLTPIGAVVCIISETGIVHLYSLETGQQTLQFELEDSHATCSLSDITNINNVPCLTLGGDNGTISFHALENGEQIGQLKAFECPLNGMFMKNHRLICSGQNTQLKVWDFNKLVTEGGVLFMANELDRWSLYDETSSTNIELSLCSRYVYTSTKKQMIYVWDVQSGELKNSYSCGLVPTDLRVARGEQEVLVAFSKMSQNVKVLSGSSGENIIDNMPPNVLTTVLTKDRSTLYVITHVDGRLKLYEDELRRARLARSFFLQKGLSFQSVEALLSHTERYLVIKVECTPEDRKAIESQWKRGGFAPQPHPYRFSAIDLTHTSGTLLHCYRQLSKIPALGSAMIAHTGNTMIFCVRRCVCFWDIPTGRCDQMITKSGRHGMFYNPSWLGGGDGDGAAFVSCMVEADDKSVVVMGSGDGYATTYRAETGAPVGMKAPLTKHNAPVHMVTISGDSKWIFSACQKNVLKMWEPGTASELFSLRLDGNIRSMRTSPDSRHLVLLTGTLVTRVLVFIIFPGKPDSDNK